MFELSPRMFQMGIAFFCAGIEICVLSFHGSESQILGPSPPTDASSGFNLGIAGSVFFLIGFTTIIAVHFIDKPDIKKYTMWGIIGIMTLALLLLIIAAGLVGKQYQNTYNIAAMLFFIQLMLYFIALGILYMIYQKKETNVVQNLNESKANVTEQTEQNKLKQRH